MNIDSRINILWLSDIHYCSNYTKDNKNEIFKSFIDSFLEKCGEFEDIDYLLLSGDVAQRGSKEDYELFFYDILTPLLSKLNFKKTKLLVVSGNHDVSRKDAIYFEDFINNLSGKKGGWDDFLNENKEAVEKSFKFYSDSFKKFEDRLPNNISKQYKNDFLHGYFVDHEKKAIVILLNSSWFSFGDEFIKRYFNTYFKFLNFPVLNESQVKNIVEFISKESENNSVKINEFIKEGIFNFFKNIYEIDFSKKQIQNIIDYVNKELELSFDCDKDSIKDVLFSKRERSQIINDLVNITEEYGKQIINLEAFNEFDFLMNDIKTFNEYVCIQCFHHPINWLSMDERINYNTPTVSKFFELQNELDVLLTGHEHIPVAYPSDYFKDNSILSIPAGCFINHHSNPSLFNVNNNWFSVLSINTKKRAVTQNKYLAKNVLNSIKWELINQNIKPLKKKALV